MANYGKLYQELYPDFDTSVERAGSHDMTVLSVMQDSHETEDPAVADVVFRLVTRSTQTKSSVDLGDGEVSLSTRSGSFYLAPADAISNWQSEGVHELLMLAVPKTRLEELLPGSDTDDPLRSLYGTNLHNEMIAGLMRQIKAESARHSASSSLKVDGLFMTLLGTLLEQAGTDTPSEGYDVAPLDERRLDRVLDYMDANLQSRIRIEDLANVACLSPFHFSRAFRAALGIPPHKFLTKRRIEAATEMLATSSAGLSDIAILSGFSSQAHFTRQFTRQMGMSPGKYRRSLG